jgi:hypothetical protein
MNGQRNGIDFGIALGLLTSTPVMVVMAIGESIVGIPGYLIFRLAS